MTEPQPVPESAPRGPGSFCIPRAAIEALLDAQATVTEICAYLVLAKFTDASGRYSTASIAAINRYTGSNKGTISKAVERLKSIKAAHKVQVSNGRTGRYHAMVEQRQELGPILIDRNTWQTTTSEILPDGPTERSKVLFVLPDFDEPLDTRIWFGGNLVTGLGGFNRPLGTLKHAGNVAARLLLAMYAATDMETWGGVRPIGAGCGPWKRYEPVEAYVIPLHGGARLIRAKDGGIVAAIHDRISGGDKNAYWRALEALQSSGLIYEVVMVLNREAIKATFTGGEKYGGIADDAEPYCELDCRSRHGYKPEGEEGIGGATASTAGALGYPVTERTWGMDGDDNVNTASATFDGTYAAIVRAGFPAMVAGIFRLRFRVANPKNAGVRNAWARIHQNNREAFEFVQAVRAANRLDPLVAPWEPRKTPAPAAAET